jgi:hypothetical protein
MDAVLPKQSLIQHVLDFTVKDKRPPIGLNYAAYAVSARGPFGMPEAGVEIVGRSSNRDFLQVLLDRFAGPSRTAEEQLAKWEELLPKVHVAFTSLDGALVRTGQGENVRAVLDVDMGGFFYNRISSHAFLFAAALDQSQINNGRCDREMQQMVSEIQALFTAHGA